MMHMILHTFTHPLTNTEVAALAIRHWPMPCVIKIIKPNPLSYYLDGWMVCGMDFGRGGTTRECVIDVLSDSALDVILTLDHPVLPRALPIELKGVAV